MVYFGSLKVTCGGGVSAVVERKKMSQIAGLLCSTICHLTRGYGYRFCLRDSAVWIFELRERAL